MLFVDFFEMALFGRFLLQTQFPVGQVATARYFNPHWWNQGHSIKSTQLVQKGSLLLLAVTASLMLAFRRHSCWRRCGNGRWKTASWCKPERTCRTRNRRAWPAPLPPAKAESGIEILARAIDGRKLPIEDFRKFTAIASLLPVAGMPSGLSMIGASRTLPRRCPSLRPCR